MKPIRCTLRPHDRTLLVQVEDVSAYSHTLGGSALNGGKPPLAFGQGPSTRGKPPLAFGQGPSTRGKPPLAFGQGPSTRGKPPLAFGQGPSRFLLVAAAVALSACGATGLGGDACA